MNIDNLNHYTIRVTNEGCRCVSVNGRPISHFVDPDSRRGIQKLYVLKSSAEIYYVGITSQPMSSRFWIGYQVNSRTGYHGYKWRSQISQAELLVWCFTGDDRDAVESVEGELVYLIRNRTGNWPKYQMEIHFHPDATDEEKRLAWAMLDDCFRGQEQPDVGDFDRYQERLQTAWREERINKEWGTQNGKQRPWILPREAWELGLWPQIRSSSKHSLPAYLQREKVEKHEGVHNLKSSWILCANLYFPFERDLQLVAGFLRQHVEPAVESVEKIELEYAEDELSPARLLGEPEGQRGRNQTSPDIAFFVRLQNHRRGLILVENKLAEHSFYECSGREAKSENPDLARCLDFAALAENPKQACFMTHWARGRRTDRRYWDYVAFSSVGLEKLKRCPAAIAGSQLFRQQALAEAIAREGPYERVVSCVAYDARNQTLIRSMRGTGIPDFTRDWAPLFEGQARFTTFTHQQWIRWVQSNDVAGNWREWLEYVCSRYEL